MITSEFGRLMTRVPTSRFGSYHHPGPFDGVRLEYNVLRNPVRRADHFLRCVQEFAAIGAVTEYRSVSLGSPPDMTPLQADIAAVVRHWAAEGIAVGSRR